MKKTTIFAVAAGVLLAWWPPFPPPQPRAEADPSASWNRKAAAAYLDQRATWWTTWPTAQRDHGTFCVSCHTALPYALARPQLRQPLGETAPSAGEAALLANITKRVTMWREVEPFYPDQTRGVPKTSESRATEAILNAVILSRRDARSGSLSEEGRRALDNMWALQMKTGEQTGAWTWLQFHNEPWEGDSSPFHGATLAAIAIHAAPGGYAASPENQDRVKALHDYLRKANEQRAPLLEPRDAAVGVHHRSVSAFDGARRSRRIVFEMRCCARSRRTAGGARRRWDRGSGTTARRSTRAPTVTPPAWRPSCWSQWPMSVAQALRPAQFAG